MVVGASRGVFVSTNRGGRARTFSPPRRALMFFVSVANLGWGWMTASGTDSDCATCVDINQ